MEIIKHQLIYKNGNDCVINKAISIIAYDYSYVVICISVVKGWFGEDKTVKSYFCDDLDEATLKYNKLVENNS